MKQIGTTMAIFAGLVLGGCAASGGGAERMQAETVCLSDYQITSFSPVGDSHLYVAGVGDRHYLFTMERGCFGLRSANTIGIPDRVGRICANSSDRVIYRDMARGIESCRILDIEIVSSSEEARTIAKQREEMRREGE